MDMKVNLGTVVASHLNDAMLEMYVDNLRECAEQRVKFVKALTFFNENLERDVTSNYLNWLWKEIFTFGRTGTSYKQYSLTIAKSIK